MIFDEFVDNWQSPLIDTSSFPNYSVNLGNELTSKNLFFNGNNAEAVSPNNIKPKLYSPIVWEPGSSVYHLDEDLYPFKDKNSCMTPILKPTEVIHSPGSIMLASLIDMGWTINRIINIFSPLSSEIWAQGSNQVIKWTDTETSLVNIELTDWPDNMSTWIIEEDITSNKGTNELEWLLWQTVPAGYYQIKISDETGNISLSQRFKYDIQIPILSKPIITPEDKYFIDPLAIDIDSPTSGAEIRYTTNGDDVTSSSPIFNSHTIYESTTIKARAYASSGESSSLVQKTYIKGVEPIIITATNRLLGGSTQMAGVELWNNNDNIWEDNGDDQKPVKPDEDIILRFDSTYNSWHGKFYQTKEGTHTPNTAYLNYAIFNPYETNENTSFIGWRLETYNTSLAVNISEYPNLQWGDKYIKFSDPWLYDDTHPLLGKQNRGNLAEFHTRKTSFEPNTDTEFKGVIRDRWGYDNEPTYKLACPKQEISLNGKIYNFVFTNWSTNGKASITSINKDTAKVVFGQDNSEVVANLKGIHLSNDANAFSNNSQRQTVRTPEGVLHMVYESMGKAWYERSSDNGVTWELVGALNQGRGAKNPSIDFMWDVPSQAGDGYKTVSIVCDGNINTTNEWGVILENYFLIDEAYQTYGTSVISDPNNLFTESHNSNPVIALGVEQKFMTIWINEQNELICGYGSIVPMGGFGGWNSGYPKETITNGGTPVGENFSLVSTKNYDVNDLSSFYIAVELKSTSTLQSAVLLSKLKSPSFIDDLSDDYFIEPKYINTNPSVSLITDQSNNKKLPIIAIMAKDESTDFIGYAKVIDWGNKAILSSTSFGSNVTSVQTSAPDYGEYGSNEALVVWKESNDSYLQYNKYQNNTFNEVGYLSEIGSCFSLCSGGENLSQIKPYVLKTNSLPYEIVKAELVSGIPSVITSNYTITSGTYQINGNLTVNNGVTLTIESGANITFQDGFNLYVYGTLKVEGASSNKVTLDFLNGSGSIYSYQGANVNIENAIIKNGYCGIYAYYSNPTIKNTTLSNHYFGVKALYSAPYIENCTITGSSYGIYAYKTNFIANDAVILNNNINSNYYGVYLYNSDGKMRGNNISDC